MINDAIFKKIGPGMCRLSANGKIAVSTSNGYKAYDVKTGKLTNCDGFVFDIGEEFFFVVPATNVKPGDIILVNGKPKCVKETGKDQIVVINYEDSTIETLVPERHMFMGNVYFYSKIVSMFGGSLKGENIYKYMMLSSIIGKNNASNSGGLNPMMMYMMMNKDSDSMFDGIFDMDFDISPDAEETED